MACDKCGPNREKGFSFCPDCGSPLKEGCVYCAQYEREGYEFCGKCGRRLDPVNRGAVQENGPFKMAALAVMPFLVILLVAEIVMMLSGIGGTFDYLEDKSFKVLMLLPALTAIGTISGTALQYFWILLVVVIVSSSAIVLYQSRCMFKPRKDGDTSQAEKTPFYWVCLTFGALMLVELAVTGITMVITGDPFEVPDWIGEMNAYEAFYSMANAAVWEEVISRMLPIGIPMVIIAACYGRKDFLKNILGGFGVSRLSLFLLVASAFMFGMAHVNGWGWSKFLPTFLAGLVMGYLYIRFGVHVSIMFHFLTDYLSTLMFNDLSTMLVGGLVIILLVTGAVCLGAIAKKLSDGLKNIGKLPVTGFEPGIGDENN